MRLCWALMVVVPRVAPWSKEGRPWKSCNNWVKHDPEHRCHHVDDNGVTAWDACAQCQNSSTPRKKIGARPSDATWLSPGDTVPGDLLAPLDGLGEYPSAFVQVGDLSARPVLGDDSRLRTALRASRANASRVFKVLVVGGSPASGEGCEEVAASDDDTYAWFYETRTRRGSECSWAARLSRYLVRYALPRGNALVVNAARGGCSSEYLSGVF